MITLNNSALIFSKKWFNVNLHCISSIIQATILWFYSMYKCLHIYFFPISSTILSVTIYPKYIICIVSQKVWWIVDNHYKIINHSMFMNIFFVKWYFFIEKKWSFWCLRWLKPSGMEVCQKSKYYFMIKSPDIMYFPLVMNRWINVYLNFLSSPGYHPCEYLTRGDSRAFG